MFDFKFKALGHFKFFIGVDCRLTCNYVTSFILESNMFKEEEIAKLSIQHMLYNNAFLFFHLLTLIVAIEKR